MKYTSLIKLTKEQKKVIEDNILSFDDIASLAKLVFSKKGLTETSEEVKAIKEYLKFKTERNSKKLISIKDKKLEKKDPYFFDFTEDQIQYILDEGQAGATIVEICKVLFPHIETPQPLGKECRYILSVFKRFNVDPKSVREGGLIREYRPPRSLLKVLSKVCESTQTETREDQLTKKQRLCLQRLQKTMNSSRFIRIMNGYTNVEDKDLFEQEFIRSTWDKEDLTPEETNMYLNLCRDMVLIETIVAQREKINILIDGLDEDMEFSKNLSESIKALENSYSNCRKSISDATTKLAGNRAKRLEQHAKENSSIINLVNAWQEDKTRKEMIRLSEQQKLLVKDEVKRLSDMDDFRAKILGIAEDDSV